MSRNVVHFSCNSVSYTHLDAVDKIRDTATSHERLFFVEVMGRDAVFLALNGAIAAGAEASIIAEFSTEVDQLEVFIEHGFRKSKSSSIVLVAESELTGGAMHYAERVKNEYPQYLSLIHIYQPVSV